MPTCPWPIDIEACCTPTGLAPDDPKVISIIAQVSVMLSRWSGYRFGGCKTARPLEPCRECRSGCCASGDCIVLHDATGVSEVRVHGDIVPETDWHYDSARGILCATPPLEWPKADPRFEDIGSLEVDVTIGEEPDAWALAVAQELACELITACTGGKCRLPKNVTQVTGQGVTIQLDVDEIIYAIPAVRAWVETVNPLRASAPARIFSPEADRARVMGSRMGISPYPFSRVPWGR